MMWLRFSAESAPPQSGVALGRDALTIATAKPGQPWAIFLNAQAMLS